jgi:hypothetical protein
VIKIELTLVSNSYEEKKKLCSVNISKTKTL